MVVYISNSLRTEYVNLLSAEIYEEILAAVEESLNKLELREEAFVEARNDAMFSRVCDLEDIIDIEYVAQDLSFYVIDNLRSMQDEGKSWSLMRVDSLQNALNLYEALPRESTAVIGMCLTGGKFGIGEFDIVHRVQGEDVLVNDFKFSERWKEDPLVLRAVGCLNERLKIKYEYDSHLFNAYKSEDTKDVDDFDLNFRKFEFRYLSKSVLVPRQDSGEMNSYYRDKYLRPADKTYNLLSAINQVFVEGNGWIEGDVFMRTLADLNFFEDPTRYKVSMLNVNYVDLDGRWGQTDMLPSDFHLLREQTIERTAKRRDIDAVIDEVKTSTDLRKSLVNNSKSREER